MKKYTHETYAGLFVVLGLIVVAYMTVTLGHVSFLGRTYPLNAKFTNVSGLRAGSSVDMMGIEVGQVEQITLDQKDQMAVVEMRIKEGVKVYGDAIASIKTEGLIGDKYVSIDPGGAEKPLKPGGTILATQPAVDIGEIVGKYVFGGVKGSEENIQAGGGNQ
ncbi:MAG: outer membrane lipid asymmetry maintenance protein MlaD [Deltaproteobacteria bacterium]|nr:outer membrane lipid asymmetry maintenance protein MlaD [Deltaproteobacteria bacterium]